MLNSKPRTILIISCLMYLAFGMFNAAIGPVLGELAENTSTSLVLIGSVITFLFMGSLAAQLIAGPLMDKLGLHIIVLVSLLLAGFGLPLFINARSFPLMLALVLFTGLGQGGIDLSANLLVSAAYPKNTAFMLNLLHFFFGLGSFFGPALVSLSIVVTGSGMLVHWVAAGIFLILAAVMVLFRSAPRQTPAPLKTAAGEIQAGKQVYRSPVLWLLSGLILLYVGVEVGLGSWTTRFLAISTQMAEQNGALVTSAYWGALTIGRLAVAAVSRRISHTRLLTIMLSLSLVGSFGIFFSLGTVLPTILFIILTGFSFGTIYPTSVAVTMLEFPEDQGKSVGLLAAMGSMGGLVLPWAAGIMLETVSPMLFALFICACIVVLFILLLTLSRTLKKSPVR